MDSLTQFALGAGVGVALLGRRLGPRRAILVGGALGVAPDLDVFFPFADPVDSFTLHRGHTHSLILQAAVTPLFGEGLRRLMADLRQAPVLLTYAAVYLCLATHALLDAVTIYGTRLLWPLWDGAVGVGSIFIIDPLYTLPLLVLVIWGLCLHSWSARLRGVVIAGLGLSTAYLGWGLVGQQVTEARARTMLAEAGVAPERMMVTPTPFNTLLWRAIVMDGDRYLNVYLPLFAPGTETVYAHPSGRDLAGCLNGNPALGKLATFSHGFFRVDGTADRVVVSDLRMGLTPHYAFRFVIAEERDGELRPVPPRRLGGPRSADGDWSWLWAGLHGERNVRPVEIAAAIDPAALKAPESVAAKTSAPSCQGRADSGELVRG